jgi:glycosyltransferase involved in cell wall biosynthesis
MRGGGLVAYTEDLMEEQLRRGDEVAYFFAGRYYPLIRRTRLRRWAHGDLAMLEVIDSPLYDHGRQPELELAEPRIERLLGRVLAERAPDVVHVHELAGLPSSIFDVIERAGLPCVFTLQDYFPLCSTFKLFDHAGHVCLRRQVGADCVATNAADPRPPGVMVEATVRHELHRRAGRLGPGRIDAIARAAGARVKSPPPAGEASYQRRRDANVERLNRTDLLIAMSNRVAEIYVELGVERRRIRVLHLTLGHVERMRPRVPRGEAPVTFGGLNVLSAVPKGARLLTDAVRILASEAPRGSFRVLAFGHVHPSVRADAEATPGLELHGPYWPDRVDALLDPVDVGVVPSIWEEAYGYVGIEFLAKGIPVIANALGGMVDYTVEGETGWLNRSMSAEELAGIMLAIVERPEQVADLNAKIRAARDAIVKPMARHADEMESIYRDLT